MVSSEDSLHWALSRLTKVDVRLLGLFFEGLSDAEIEKETGMPHGTLRHHVLRLHALTGSNRRAREALVRFYIDHLLKCDLQGKPLDKDKEAYAQPGEKLAEWTAWAQKQRDLIWADPRIQPHMYTSAMVLTKPGNAGKSFMELGRLVPNSRGGMGIKGGTYGGQLRMMYSAMGGGKRPRLFVVVMLAPLV